MYNSVNRVCKSIKIYIYWVKKDLFWACLKGVTLQKTFKEESTHKNHYDDKLQCFHIRDARSLSLKYLPSFSEAAPIDFVLNQVGSCGGWSRLRKTPVSSLNFSSKGHILKKALNKPTSLDSIFLPLPSSSMLEPRYNLKVE